MPIDYKKYPPNWKTEIRPRILARANNCCEECSVPNYAIGVRLPEEPANFVLLPEGHAADAFMLDAEGKLKAIKIVLTVAHLDHDPENWDVKDDRLKALCQRCHLQYDAKTKGLRRRRRVPENQIAIF